MEKRGVMSHYYGSKISGSQQQKVFATAKNQQVQIRKRTTLQVYHAFWYISYPLLHDCNMELPDFTRPLSTQCYIKVNAVSLSFQGGFL